MLINQTHTSISKKGYIDGLNDHLHKNPTYTKEQQYQYRMGYSQGMNERITTRFNEGLGRY